MNSNSQSDGVRFIDCNETDHAPAILEILNDAIVNSTALYDYKPRPPEAMATWFGTRRANGFPVVGAVDEAGTLLGFASWGTFRAFPANKYTVEHSVYVHRDQRGRGLGESLLLELIRRAREQQIHVLVGCIDATNAGSIALHAKLGFTHSGTIKEVGFKFGRWLDAAFYQLNLEMPAPPVDG
ncbi:GNAT family N-acetyltransferase [Paraburkholderia silvatlantica]|uniref:Phosphinothricin acetyltransferase n=1 Tax=Paraburkholderia silvatlantica TaxID=321895 RepID=A0A2U1A8H5_9BURK|nr:GNAT family N-acetyltransferase [Paraburkholderia silvatlantica]MBB2929080.1 phosphinothricin acetyltransferase [Paraburkholderia silvatlantica]PVY29175.1 phosphinothricin acetyltransferase [Paraburkholderia silvatlantica]PXW36650.1 phosphinothricin acetyltransferase [Paraburkholderia silvatlantica]PYE22134.1 phosphinothricin acetyltransferase [Paraburkholderia silvatlantica]TDQ99038.1 phosphinothricin acetyltransferase [Paraburkholderia silvatlantica]